MGIEHSIQFRFPIGRAFVDAPWMIAEARQHLRMRCGQLGHRRPVRFAAAIDHHALYLRTFGQQDRLSTAEALSLQMIVGVVEIHFACSVRRAAA